MCFHHGERKKQEKRRCLCGCVGVERVEVINLVLLYLLLLSPLLFSLWHLETGREAGGGGGGGGGCRGGCRGGAVTLPSVSVVAGTINSVWRTRVQGGRRRERKGCHARKKKNLFSRIICAVCDWSDLVVSPTTRRRGRGRRRGRRRPGRASRTGSEGRR